MDLNFIDAVNERDIDLLLLEEFHVSHDFRLWTASGCGLDSTTSHTFKGAWRSITDARLGESDLIMILTDSMGVKHAILIENKIDAPPQPEQAERYHARGRAGIEQGAWDSYRTCIVAPAKYLSNTANTEEYDSQISYEDIGKWFQSSCPECPRHQYKVRFIREAIERNRRGYQVVPDPQVTKFYHDYYEIVSTRHPELAMPMPGAVPSQSDWIRFFPDGLGNGFRLRHKLRVGRVDLEMVGCAEHVEEIQQGNAELLDESMDVIQTGKSASICVYVPTADRFTEMREQAAAVDAALAAAMNLWKLSGKVAWPSGDHGER